MLFFEHTHIITLFMNSHPKTENQNEVDKKREKKRMKKKKEDLLFFNQLFLMLFLHPATEKGENGRRDVKAT